MWIEKTRKDFSVSPCAGPGRGSRNTFTAGNGYHPGGDSGDVGGTGKPGSPAGTWHWREARGDAAAGQLANVLLRSRASGDAKARQLVEVLLCGQARGHAKARQLVDTGPARPGRAPSISYMEGALFYSTSMQVMPRIETPETPAFRLDEIMRRPAPSLC
jgi:hypothetical protein